MNNLPPKNIFPIFDQTLSQSEKQTLLHQKAVVLWLVGFSGAGKSTIANALERKLFENKYFTALLDGDNLRAGINNNLGFKPEHRLENIRRTAEIARILLQNGIITICTFVSPLQNMRTLAKNIVGDTHFFEIYINASLATCEKRDVKGLYKKARNHEIENFTGISAPFEPPTNPHLTLYTDQNSIEECTQQLFEFILPYIKF